MSSINSLPLQNISDAKSGFSIQDLTPLMIISHHNSKDLVFSVTVVWIAFFCLESFGPLAVPFGVCGCVLDLAPPRAIALFASTRSQAVEWLAVPRGRRTGSLSTTATRTHEAYSRTWLTWLDFLARRDKIHGFQSGHCMKKSTSLDPYTLS